MKHFANLSTRAKLLFSFGLIMFMFIVVISIAYNSIKKVTLSEKLLYDVQFSIAFETVQLRSHENRERANILAMMLSKDKSEQKALEEDILAHGDSVDRIFQTLKYLDVDQIFKTNLAELESNIAEHREGRMQEIALIKAGKIEEARLMETGIQAKRFEKIRNLTYAMSYQARSDAGKQLNIDIRESNKSIFIFILLGTVAFFTSIIIVIILNNTIVKPLNGLTNIASQIASGDLKVEVNTKVREDEIGILSQAFDQMVTYLRQFILDINEVVSVLATSSSQILAATTQVATGTSESATAISETSTTVEEVQQASKLSSQKAKNVADSAQRVVQVFQDGQNGCRR